MSYMQQIYTPIDPPSFDHKANDKTTLTSGPTSSAFGLIFANGILNASTPNSKASHYFMDPVDTSEYGLSPPPMTPSSSRESTGGTTHNQVLELIRYVKLCSPRRLDDSIWTASVLIFFSHPQKGSSQIFFEAINHNWRLSEDAEKKFRSKAHLITPPVHRVLLCFAGILHIPASKLENKHLNKGLRHSVITNPLSFCFLLLDFDLWSSTSLDVQQFHCESLCGMIETISIWSRFSMKGISKMNLLPKMLHALRNRQFSVLSEDRKVIPAYIRLLGCVLKAQFNAQIIRHLAIGETKPDESKDDQEPQSTLSKLNVPVSDLKSLSTSITLDEPILVLKVLHDLLLSPNDQESCSYITQFLKAINGSKWLLMFFQKDTHPENTLAVLAKFCFINETVLVTTLSLLSQVDIRMVPMFSTTRSSDPPGTSPLMFKDDLQVRCSEENMTSIYVKEWLNLRMESQDDRWNEMLGDKDVVKVWVNYVLILSCVPHQESLQHIQETPGDGTKTDMIPSSPEASCLSSFPLTSNLLGLGQAARPHGGVSTIPSSTIGYDHTSVDTSNSQNKKRMSNRQSRLAMSSVTVSVTAPTTLMINGEMVPSTSPRIPANHLTDTPFECFFEDDPTSTTASLYCYNDALEEVLDWMLFVTESEMKANQMRSDMQNKSQVMWSEFSNKGSIESRRLEGVVKKLEVWARSVKEIDASRFANLRQDNFDTKHYLEMHLSKRLGELYRPFSILAQAQDNSATYWALDSTEGPSRQRKKLQRLAQNLGASRRDSYRDEETYDEYKKRGDGTSPTSLTHPESLLPSSELWGEESGEYDDLGAQVNADGDTRPAGDQAPKKTSLDQSVGKTNGKDAHTEDFNEDKSRRILKSLEAGDVIQGVWNVEQRTNGELVNSWDTWEERDPHLRTLASLSRQTAKLNSRAAAHQTRRWNYSDIVSISSHGRSRLLTFSNQRRDEALKRLRNCIRRSRWTWSFISHELITQVSN
ncbi:hypothetical protein MJO28_015883 [Puccinia striiformis f. sp. tritici]|uniref:Uncharacterized protein n=1 Tax=Puccinia striiformis f. sp. tritici TaxID=168172 RepID=A0ACC0DQ06_9BASI|nr:hypothetical protein MJO28_015883 [Puccinia striiformis f. sp. tritici]